MRNKAKEEYLKHMCDKITNSYNRSPKEAHRLIKKLNGSCLQQRSIKGLRSKSGKLLSSSNEVMCRWEEYVRELYSDASRVDKPLLFTPPLDGDELLLSELKHAVMKTKLGKAEGPDGVSTEMFLHLSEEGKSLLHKALNALYNSGEIPRAWQKSNFIALPKSSNANDCEDHWTISLICHGLKILLKILLKRTKNLISPQISGTQFGFTPDSGTRNAVFVFEKLNGRIDRNATRPFLLLY